MNRSGTSLVALAAFLIVTVCLSAAAQSRDVNFPTPVVINEITGVIAARDIGDSRVTSYYYTFDGGQGDIFINLVTKNFAGDVDVFIADGLRPMTKMVVFADSSESETGRLIYLRKPEKLILRIEGRTPNDDPATFRIKLGGSFIASTERAADEGPSLARQDPNEPGVKVNSVGTIVAVIPKPAPPKPEPVAKSEPPASAGGQSPTGKAAGSKPEPRAKKAESPPSAAGKTAKIEPSTKKEEPPAKAPIVVVTENIKPPPTETTAKATSSKKKPKAPVEKAEAPAPKSGKIAKTKPPTKTPTAEPPDPLANVRLVIDLKDGTTVWRPMTEVQRFGFDKGVLTVVGKDGSVTRYPILDVAKVTMQ